MSYALSHNTGSEGCFSGSTRVIFIPVYSIWFSSGFRSQSETNCWVSHFEVSDTKKNTLTERLDDISHTRKK